MSALNCCCAAFRPCNGAPAPFELRSLPPAAEPLFGWRAAWPRRLLRLAAAPVPQATGGPDSKASSAQSGPTVAEAASESKDAEFWRIKGNDCFRFGDMIKAKDCYQKSISASPSATAYANRALACSKLKEWEGAEHDCSQVRFSQHALGVQQCARTSMLATLCKPCPPGSAKIRRTHHQASLHQRSTGNRHGQRCAEPGQALGPAP